MSADPKYLHPAAEIEPTTTATTVPMWLIGGMLLLMFLGAWYFDARGGWFNPKVYEPYVSIPDLERFQPPKTGEEWRPRGRALFDSNCALCHNVDGTGKPGQAPPLAGSEWVLAAGVNRLIRIPQVGLAGPIEVKGQVMNFPIPMAAMGAPYSDDDLAAVLSYIRNSFGNKAPVVTADHIKKVRGELGGRSQAYSPDELKKLPE